MNFHQKVMPTYTVEVVDHEAVLKELQKGPVNYACTYEQMAAIKSRLNNKGVQIKTRRNVLNGEVLGWYMELTNKPIKRRDTK